MQKIQPERNFSLNLKHNPSPYLSVKLDKCQIIVECLLHKVWSDENCLNSQCLLCRLCVSSVMVT